MSRKLHHLLLGAAALLFLVVVFSAYASVSGSFTGFDKGGRPCAESVLDELPDMRMEPPPQFVVIDPSPAPAPPDKFVFTGEGFPASVFHPPTSLA